MTISNFIPEVWSAQILSKLRHSIVYASPVCVNRNYEGDISAFGDTVHITSVGDVSISDYTKYTDLTIQTLDDDGLALVIDQRKAFAFEIDDIDTRQARDGGALMAEATQSAAFGLRDVADKWMRDLMAAGASTALGVVDGSTASNVYEDLIVQAGVKLDEKNVPSDGRFLVVTPGIYGKLQLDSRFIEADKSGTAALHNGVVGDAAGFTILKSNNGKLSERTVTVTNTSGEKTLVSASAAFTQADVGLAVTGTGVASSSKVASVSTDGKTATLDKATSGAVTSATVAAAEYALAGTSMGASYAEQILQTEAFRPEKRFTDALKGLHVYGGKVVRGDALVAASVKLSS